MVKGFIELYLLFTVLQVLVEGGLNMILLGTWIFSSEW